MTRRHVEKETGLKMKDAIDREKWHSAVSDIIKNGVNPVNSVKEDKTGLKKLDISLWLKRKVFVNSTTWGNRKKIRIKNTLDIILRITIVDTNLKIALNNNSI